MTAVTLEDAQTRLAELIRSLQPGEELLITDHNTPVAKLQSTSPSTDTDSPSTRWLNRWSGSLQGRETPAPDDERTCHILDKHLR